MSSSPLQVLLIEDNPGDARLVEELLLEAAEFHLETEERLSSGLVRLAAGGVGVVLLDLGLPDSKGLDTLRQILPRAAQVPVVVFTGLKDEEVGQAAVREGAQDYLVKGRVSGYELCRAIRHAIERGDSQSRLRERERWFSTLFEANPGGLVLIERAHRTIVQVNTAAASLLGLPRESIVGRVCQGFICPFEGGACPVCEPGQVMSQSEQVMLTGAGDRVPVLKTVATLQKSGVDYVLECFLDLTESKKAEQERSRLEAQLRASQRMEAVGTLAGGVAHDFNNLLTVIQGYTAFALESVREGDTLREDLQEIRKAADRASTLTSQLLAFGRKQVLQPRLLDLGQIVSEMEKMLRRIIGEDLELRLDIPPELGLVRADPGQLEQVLMNLVVNARDAMPLGGKLTLELANVELDEEYAATHAGSLAGPHVMLAVSDTGSGMDALTCDRIFEPFFTTKERGKGTGLGLATVYGIVKQSGGSIWVYSELGCGTTFKLYFQRDLSGDLLSTAPAASQAGAGGTETILVVEDEAGLRRVVDRVLQKAGFTVLTANGPSEATQLSRDFAGPIHLLLTDVVMPVMSGRVLAERLTAGRPELKVLFMSGYTDNTIIHHGVLDAGTRFLAKPFTAARLTRKVREVLDE